MKKMIEDSNYYDIKKLSQYNDTLKVVRSTAVDELQWKIYLNSLYGRLLSTVHFAYGMEDNDVSPTTRTRQSNRR